MDDIVLQAMRKWPHVPACTGWLGLDARGHWYMRDHTAQAAGAFPNFYSPASHTGDTTAARGSRLMHDGLIAFIHRNYTADAQGRWFFQNGPQRVYVELQAAPWILRIGTADTGFAITTHTADTVQASTALCDEDGHLYLVTPLGLGLVHTQDTLQAANALEHAHWPLEHVHRATLPIRFGFIPSPHEQANQENLRVGE